MGRLIPFDFHRPAVFMGRILARQRQHRVCAEGVHLRQIAYLLPHYLRHSSRENLYVNEGGQLGLTLPLFHEAAASPQ
jgi:hypothetical protein